MPPADDAAAAFAADREGHLHDLREDRDRPGLFEQVARNRLVWHLHDRFKRFRRLLGLLRRFLTHLVARVDRTHLRRGRGHGEDRHERRDGEYPERVVLESWQGSYAALNFASIALTDFSSSATRDSTSVFVC